MEAQPCLWFSSANIHVGWLLEQTVIDMLSLSGLVTSTVSSELFQAAQPALLYLVPFTLLPLLFMAYLKVCSKLFNSQLT